MINEYEEKESGPQIKKGGLYSRPPFLCSKRIVRSDVNVGI
jgi:hypothetical protein